VSEPAHQAPAVEGSEPGHEPEEPDTAAELAERLAEAEDRYRRALADLDNLRKRTSREIERRVEESRESLLRDWLEALDSVERALRMTPEGAVRTGLRSVLDQMEVILARHAVERIGRVGEPFDPERHEAVGVRESDQVPDRTVVDVARSGFAIGRRVLRPAQVIVSRRPEPEA
jgi:molecular chaperone GrpE